MVRSAGAVLAVAALVVGMEPSRAEGGLDVAEVRARIAHAAGVRPASERIVADVTIGGVPGTETEERAGNDYRVDRTLGPFHSAHGSSAGSAWQQDENGQTALAAIDSERIANEGPDDALPPRLARVSAPLDAYEISAFNASGFGTREFVDPATWRVVREDRISSAGTTTTTFDDFRATAGYVRAWHRSVRDGHPEDDQDYRVTSVETAAIPPNDLLVPGPARRFAEFPAGATSEVLPAQFERDEERFIVRVNVNGRGLDFVLDTGASHVSIDRDVAESLGLRQYGSFSNAANAGPYVGTKTIVPEMDVGPLIVRDAVLETIPHVEQPLGPYRVVGLLGFDFFCGMGVKFDYEHGTVTAYDRPAIVAPQAPGTIALDVRLGSHQPETSIAINGARGDRFVLDSGGVGSVLIADHFRRHHPEAIVGVDPRIGGEQTMLGLGGSFDAKPIRVDSMLVGDRDYDDFFGFLVESQNAYGGNQDGLIGPKFLALFTMYVDYPDRKIYLTPALLGRDAISARLGRSMFPTATPIANPTDDPIYQTRITPPPRVAPPAIPTFTP